MQNIIYILILLLLIKIAFIDYKQKIIPDGLNLIIALLGIFNLILNYENCKIYIASTAIVFAVFLFIAIVTDGGIGGGDIKLFTALGLIFGQELMLIVAVTFTSAASTSLAKIIFKKASIKEIVALAPYICLGVFICLIKIYIS